MKALVEHENLCKKRDEFANFCMTNMPSYSLDDKINFIVEEIYKNFGNLKHEIKVNLNRNNFLISFFTPSHMKVICIMNFGNFSPTV
jgi:hypothetical protein